MTKMSVFIESKTGEILGEVTSFQDKITIGASDNCTLSLKKLKLADLESEIYILNDECWLQVGKEGAPISFMGKQYRSLKITQSTLLHFRDYVLKIILDQVPEFESEATKIVNSTLADNSEATRIVSGSIMTSPIEMTSSADEPLVMNDGEATRVVSSLETTRIVTPAEATRIVTIPEATRVVALQETTFSDVELAKTKTDFQKKPKIIKEKPASEDFLVKIEKWFSSIDSSPVQKQVQSVFEKLHIKERIFPLVGIVCIVVAIFILANKDTESTSSVVAEKAEVPSNLSQPTQGTSATSPVPSEKITSQTKEQYLRDLSSLFN